MLEAGSIQDSLSTVHGCNVWPVHYCFLMSLHQTPTMTAPESNGSTTLTDHERLVNALYKPGADVPRINAVLTRYQRSQQGWQFADQLLQSQDDKVRFFGALTFTIKINTDWSTLSLEDAESLRQRLLTWLVRLVQTRDGPVVIRKVCSALVAQFLRSRTPWDRCLRHLLCCFAAGTVVGVEQTRQFHPTNDTFLKLDILELKSSLWFMTALLEEVGKTSSKASQT